MCQIPELPTGLITSLRGLRVLDLRHNAIATVPSSLYVLLPTLISFKVSGNPIGDGSVDVDCSVHGSSVVNTGSVLHGGSVLPSASMMHSGSVGGGAGVTPSLSQSQSQASFVAARDLEALSIVTLRAEEMAVKAVLQKKIWRRSLVDLTW